MVLTWYHGVRMPLQITMYQHTEDALAAGVLLGKFAAENFAGKVCAFSYCRKENLALEKSR
jgi:hypothetical protein